MELSVEKREQFGRAVHALRVKGFIPAELYGRGKENLHLSVSRKDFMKVFREAGENSIVTVVVDNKKHPVLIHDLSRDPISDEVMSIDFYEVRLDEKIRVKVPLEFVGEAPAVKLGGVLVKPVHELEVEALPADIPHSFIINVAEITEIGKSLYVKNIAVPPSVKILIKPETVVATVIAKMTEEQEKALEAEGNVEEIKVESEEKKLERDAKKEEPAEAVAAPAKEKEKAKEAPHK